MRPELDRRFAERFFAWVPYLYEELEAVERSEELRLIEAGEIQATGFRFVGERRSGLDPTTETWSEPLASGLCR